MKRIYLDHAATSWPKPEAVYAAIDTYQREIGASAGRGSYASARRADAVVSGARRAIAELIGEADPRRVVFTSSGTDSLSTAIFGVLRGGEHVVSTVCEHNAVLRPLAELASSVRAHPIRYDLVDCDAAARVDPEVIRQSLRTETRLVIVNHVSNVTGVAQEVRRIREIAHEHGALVLVDAAQSLGKMPVDVRELGADLVAAPGHKGLLGPHGVGVLWLREGVESEVRPLRYGGVAIDGAATELPTAMPHRYESGTQNVAALAGLEAGVSHLLSVGVAAISEHVSELTAQLTSALRSIAGVCFIVEPAPSSAGVVSFNIDGYDPHEAAALLEQLAGIECRAGLHCAPKLHTALGSSGAVRLSIGATTTLAEIDAVHEAVSQLASTPVA